MHVEECTSSGPKLLLVFALIVACSLPFAPLLLNLGTLSLHPFFFPLSLVLAVPLLLALCYSVSRCRADDEEVRRLLLEREEFRSAAPSRRRFKRPTVKY